MFNGFAWYTMYVGVSLFQMGIFYIVEEEVELTLSSVLQCMYLYLVLTVST